MRKLVIFILSIAIFMELFSQNKTIDREPVAAGTFYPSNPEVLKKEIEKLFIECKKSDFGKKVRALISPHAGYVFSGKIAASSFASTPRDSHFKNIFLIGSSHVMGFDGASVYDAGDFITPLGKALVNRSIAEQLKKSNPVFNFPIAAHKEDHCLEVQIPMIQYYYKECPKIVPIIIGTTSTAKIREIADALKPWFNEENLFVFSSDFSHYPLYQDANAADERTASALESGESVIFLAALRKNSQAGIKGLVTSMCGWSAGLVMLDIAEGNENLELLRIDYCNSGDSGYGDKERVVGYHSMALIDKSETGSYSSGLTGEISFTSRETDMLFSIARKCIRATLFDEKNIASDPEKIPEKLKQKLGAFVTLKINGVLRGCIGRFISSDPLYDVVKASALSSAFEDPRFPALTKDEYDKVEIEITVLGPLKRITDISEIVLGRHGIYIRKESRSGTMLPQVATEYGWSVEEFLGHTARDKAGIGWDGWKNAELYIYEGLVLKEGRD